LMDDDCYLPFNSREMPELTKSAKLSASAGDASPLVNGNDRPIGDDYNGWIAPLGSWVEFDFGTEVSDYSPVAEPRIRCGVSHLSGIVEPPLIQSLLV
jgi:hypothetical protein